MAVATRSPQPIKALLALRGLRQDQLAQAAEVSSHWLSRCINGYSQPSADLVERLSEVLGVPASELFVDDPDDVVVLVRRTTTASGVPEKLEDPTTADEAARICAGAQ